MTRVVNIERHHTVSPEELFRDIIASERLHSVFQPIVDIRRQSILGYEALIRGLKARTFSRPSTCSTWPLRWGLAPNSSDVEEQARPQAKLGIFPDQIFPSHDHKHFVRNIHSDRIKASFVASLHRMSAASNCQIIAEGVEQELLHQPPRDSQGLSRRAHWPEPRCA